MVFIVIMELYSGMNDGIRVGWAETLLDLEVWKSDYISWSIRFKEFVGVRLRFVGLNCLLYFWGGVLRIFVENIVWLGESPNCYESLCFGVGLQLLVQRSENDKNCFKN